MDNAYIEMSKSSKLSQCTRIAGIQPALPWNLENNKMKNGLRTKVI